MPQQRHLIDGVRAGDHPRDQGRDLEFGVGASRLAEGHVLGDQVMQPGPLSEVPRSGPDRRASISLLNRRLAYRPTMAVSPWLSEAVAVRPSGPLRPYVREYHGYRQRGVTPAQHLGCRRRT